MKNLQEAWIKDSASRKQFKMYLKIKQHKETKERSAPHFVFKELYVLLHQNRLLMSTLLYNSFNLVVF